MRDHRMSSDHRPIAYGDPSRDGGFSPNPDVVANDYCGGATALVQNGDVGLVEGVVVVADGDQLADKTALADGD